MFRDKKNILANFLVLALLTSNLFSVKTFARNRDNIKLPAAANGIEYRNLGVMERNVEIYAKRMKGAKSWSEKGATNLSKIIALKIGQDFKTRISALISGKLSERLTERFNEVITNTREVLLKKTVKKSIYPLHRGAIPFSNCTVTNGRKAIRNMFDLRPFSEIVYRQGFQKACFFSRVLRQKTLKRINTSPATAMLY